MIRKTSSIFRVKNFVWVFFFANLFLLPAQHAESDTSAQKLYREAAKKYHLLYEDTPFRKYQENWEKTVTLFRNIYRKHPQTIQGSKSLYNIGQLYRSLYKWNHKTKFIEQSNEAFTTIVNKHRSSNLADDAQYETAINQEIYKKNIPSAINAYRKLITLFPKSPYYDSSLNKIKELSLPLSKTSVPLSKKRSFSITHGGKLNKGAQPIPIQKIDYYTASEWTRVVINTSGKIAYQYQQLPADIKNKKNRRFYMDLLNTYLPKNFNPKIATNDGIIKKLRIAQYNKTTTRIVLDLESFKSVKVFDIELSKQNKISIDVLGKTQSQEWGFALREAADQKNKLKNNSLKETQISLSDAFGLKVRTIIIDAGHGGKDPGAMGFGMKEKDIVLELARRVKFLIEKNNSNIKVLMTRDKDKFVNLEARTAFANKNKGDLFLSIHANASENKKISGIETYFLSLTQDQDSLKLAAKENQSSIKSMSDLQSIINDLMTGSKIQESRELASMVQNSMVIKANVKSQSRIRNLGVKQAPFLVLVGSEMPSILVEVGFMSNKKENRLLKNKSYLLSLSEGIYNGVKQYINRVEKGFAPTAAL